MSRTSIPFITSDGHSVQILQWVPESEPIAIVQLVHGMAEHIERYSEFARFLSSKGFLVFGHNHPGHGPAKAASNRLGQIPGNDPFHRLVSVTHEVCSLIQKNHPKLPHFLFAHSMGSFIVQRMMQLSPPSPPPAGIIYSGSSGRPPALLLPGLLLAGLIRQIPGAGHRPSKLMDRLTFGPYNNAFKPNRTTHDWLSRDTDRVDRYVADPACGFIYPAHFYHSFFSGLRQLHNHRPFCNQPNTPVMLISGSRDPVSNMAKGVHNLEQILIDSGCHSVTKKIYPECRHELLNEIGREGVMHDVHQWMVQILSKPVASV
jgi:alpha-beta hydrolase superfamily lysophospholipase